MQEKLKLFWKKCCELGKVLKEKTIALFKKIASLCVRGAGKARQLADFKQQKKELYAEWEREAEKGNTEACYKLMMLYFDETEEYYPLAFKWTQHIACSVPDCAAMLQLAKMYDDGHGTEPHKDLALKWYEHCLSLHIIRGKNSPLSVDAANFVQERIQALRAQNPAN